MHSKNFHLALLSVLLLLNVFSFSSPAFAETPATGPNKPLEYKFSVGIPSPAGQTSMFDKGQTIPITNDTVGAFIRALYKFAVPVGAVLAIVLIMWAGFKRLTSAGNSEAAGDADEILWAALIGLGLMFATWVILNTINPHLLEMKTLGFQNIEPDTNRKIDLTRFVSSSQVFKDAGPQQACLVRLKGDPNIYCLQIGPNECRVMQARGDVSGVMSTTAATCAEWQAKDTNPLNAPDRVGSCVVTEPLYGISQSEGLVNCTITTESGCNLLHTGSAFPTFTPNASCQNLGCCILNDETFYRRATRYHFIPALVCAAKGGNFAAGQKCP